MIRKVAERSGWKYEEFEKLFQESLSSAAASEPQHHRRDIAKEIEETDLAAMRPCVNSWKLQNLACSAGHRVRLPISLVSIEELSLSEKPL